MEQTRSAEEEVGGLEDATAAAAVAFEEEREGGKLTGSIVRLVVKVEVEDVVQDKSEVVLCDGVDEAFDPSEVLLRALLLLLLLHSLV